MWDYCRSHAYVLIIALRSGIVQKPMHESCALFLLIRGLIILVCLQVEEDTEAPVTEDAELSGGGDAAADNEEN